MSVSIPADALVVVGDGRKALFLRNKGTKEAPNLLVEDVHEHSNPPAREQGTDRPGRLDVPASARRTAVEQTDWHRLEEERFAAEIARMLYKAAHANRFRHLVVVAPPKVLGALRHEYHKEVASRIVAEVDKDLTGHPVDAIEAVLAAD